MKTFRVALVLALCSISLTSCGNIDEMNDKIKVERFIKKYYPDARVQKAVRCIIDSQQDDIRSCVPDKSVWDYKNAKYENSLNMIDFIWISRIETELTPQKLASMIAAGANPGDIASDVIMSEFKYFPAFVNAAGGPNALNGGDWSDGSIMHNTVGFWDDAKVKYLQEQGVDWNQVADLSGETGVLAARTANITGSSFDRISRLIDLGANPRALDKWGRGLCDFVINPPYTSSHFDKDGKKRAALKKRLREEFSMQC